MKKVIIAVAIAVLILLIGICGCYFSCQGCRTNNTTAQYEVKFLIDNELHSFSYADFGHKIKDPEIEEREGFIFKGWYLTNEYIEQWNFSENVIKDSISLYGYWTPQDEETFNVLFYDNSIIVNCSKVLKNCLAQEYLPTEKSGYEFIGWFRNNELFDFNTPITEDISLEAKREAIVYSIKFLVDGQVNHTLSYTVENKNLFIPNAPEKAHYTCEWETFELTVGDIEINAIFTPVIYTAIFTADNAVIKELKYTVEDLVIPPSIPEKAGYTCTWDNLPLDGGDKTVNAVYTPIIYTVKFVVYDEIYEVKSYIVEDEIILPELEQDRKGYICYWEGFELNDKTEITVNAVYDLIKYKAIFIADGIIVDVVYFTIENMDITEPSIPIKDGYDAVWENYTVGLQDITINAVYTKNLK